MGPQGGWVNKRDGGMKLVRATGYCFPKPRPSLDFRLPVVADFGLDHDRPAIRFFDKNIGSAVLLKYASHIFGVEYPCPP